MLKIVIVLICAALLCILMGELAAYLLFRDKVVTYDELVRKPRYIINGEKTNDPMMYAADEIFTFKMRSNLTEDFLDQSYNLKFHFRTNSMGFRFNEDKIPVQSIPDIMVLGDSVTFGHGVNEGFAFSELLNNLYHGNKKVLNFGTGGWGFAEYYLVYKHYTPFFQPQLVIITIFTANDFNDLFNSNWAGKGKGEFPQKITRKDYYFDKNGKFVLRDYQYPILRNSRLWLFICKSWSNLQYKLGIKDMVSLSVELITDIQAHTPTLVVLMPAEYQYEHHSFKKEIFYFKEQLSSKQIPYIDFYPLFEDDQRYKRYYLDKSHLTIDGHAFVAKTIFEYLEEHNNIFSQLGGLTGSK